MKKKVLGLLIAGAVAGVPASVPNVAAAKSCSSGYTHATIGGAQKCLHAGEFCSKSLKSQYPKYGYRCVYRSGYWRLVG